VIPSLEFAARVNKEIGLGSDDASGERPCRAAASRRRRYRLAQPVEPGPELLVAVESLADERRGHRVYGGSPASFLSRR
jgi:hypothetical protein